MQLSRIRLSDKRRSWKINLAVQNGESNMSWLEALEQAGIEPAVWLIHRRIGMSGGRLTNNLLRERERRIPATEAAQLQRVHAEADARQVSRVRSLPGAQKLLAYLFEDRRSVGDCHQTPSFRRVPIGRHPLFVTAPIILIRDSL